MKMLFALLFSCLMLQAATLSAQLSGHWESRSPMPAKRANLATASLEIGDTTWIYSFMGIDSSKACGSGIRLEAWKYNTVSDLWSPIPDVPDSEGRLAASAHGVNGKVYLVGGYKVYSGCGEFTSPRVDIYDPANNSWSLGDSMPTPVDDHVQVLYRDSLIITVSGWSQNTNVRKVQIYDTFLDQWTGSNDIPVSGLFGHCGALTGDTLVFMDGVKIQGFNFILINQVVMGVIDPSDLSTINWTVVGQHPGSKMYRAGAFNFGERVIFTGGTNNPYNINGIGYNGQPSVESGRTWAWLPGSGTTEEYVHNPDSAMDVRQIVPVNGNEFYVVGGMTANQTVTNKVSVFVVDTVITGQEQNLKEVWELRMLLGNNGRDHVLDLDLPYRTDLSWQLGGLDGKVVAKGVWEQVEGHHRHKLTDLAGGLPAGVYYFWVQFGDSEKALKFVVLEK